VPTATFKSAPGHVTHGKIAGVTRTTNTRLAPASGTQARAASAAAAACAEPVCNLVYNGGPVQHTPKVYVVFWGSSWASNAGEQAAEQYLLSFYTGLGPSSETWSTVTSQYGDGSGHPAFGSSVLAGSVNDTTTPQNPLTIDELAAEATSAQSHFGITDTSNAQIVIATESGTCYADQSNIGLGLFAGSCGNVQIPSQNGPPLYCAYHSSNATTSNLSGPFLPFVVLPYQPDAQDECGQDFVNPFGTFDGFSIVGGHEYAETITDPDQNLLSTLAWVDLSDSVSGGEVADKCAWGGQPFGRTFPYGNITLSTGTFAMQSLWSNSAGGCKMTTAPVLTVATPPSQVSTLGKAVSLQIAVTTNTGVQSFTATGLPPGLSINGITGRIGGTPNTTAGTWAPTVTVRDYAKSASVKFAWHVSSAPGSINGYGYKCVDNLLGHTTANNKIVLAYCSGATEQQITFTDARQLQVQGHCITGGASVVALETCAYSTAKIWTRLSNGEYVNKATGKCLTDPNHSTANGVALTVETCANTTNQHWNVPVVLAGAIRGYASKCVDDAGGSTTAGNKIDISTCTGGTSQRITLAANNKLQVLGNCIYATSSKVILEPCSSSANEFWRMLPNQQWINSATNKCLTDPNNSTVNGTQLIVAACANTANQHWTLP
jgi:hypothetical protein